MDTKKGLECIDRTGETPSYFPKFKNNKQPKQFNLKTLTLKQVVYSWLLMMIVKVKQLPHVFCM